MAKTGRPRVLNPASERVDIRLPKDVFDAACRKALKDQKPLSTMLRELIEKHFPSVISRQTPTLH